MTLALHLYKTQSFYSDLKKAKISKLHKLTISTCSQILVRTHIIHNWRTSVILWLKWQAHSDILLHTVAHERARLSIWPLKPAHSSDLKNEVITIHNTVIPLQHEGKWQTAVQSNHLLILPYNAPTRNNPSKWLSHSYAGSSQNKYACQEDHSHCNT